MVNKNLYTEKEKLDLVVGVKIIANWKDEAINPDEVFRREMINKAFDDEAIAIAKMIREEIMKPPVDGGADGNPDN